MTYTAAILRLPSNYISTLPGTWWYKRGSTNILQATEFCPRHTRFKMCYLIAKHRKNQLEILPVTSLFIKTLHVIKTSTYHNKNINNISVPKHISFVITKFITSILDNLWEINSFKTQFLPLSLTNLKGKKVGQTKCTHLSAIFFFALNHGFVNLTPESAFIH